MGIDVKFSELVGKTLKKIERDGDDSLTFITDAGEEYSMHYEPDCCASCNIEDVTGDLDDLIGEPILSAEEVASDTNPPDAKPETIEYQESFTWTFYKIGTRKGAVTIRWYGQSNGYYSESVSFVRTK